MFRRHLAKAFWIRVFAQVAIAGSGTAARHCRKGAADGLARIAPSTIWVLKHSSEKSGIDDIVYGRMVYEFTGSACKGFKVKFRFVTAVEMGGEKRLTDQQTSTFEDLPKGQFQFETKSYSDNKLNQNVRGEAQAGKTGSRSQPQ